MRTRRKRYSAEFKREALKRPNEEGMTDVRVSASYSSVVMSSPTPLADFLKADNALGFAARAGVLQR